MKKIIALVLILTLLAGCGETPAPVSSNNQDLSSADNTASVSSVESVADASSETPTTSTVSTASKAPTTTSKPTSSKPKVDNEPAYAKAGGVIPTGATYTVKASGKVLKAGEKMPSKPADGDEFKYGDYTYKFFLSLRCSIPNKEEFIVNGWEVWANDKSKTKYGAIQEKINGFYIKHLNNTFSKCGNLVESPKIPNSVEVMSFAYYRAISLKTMPALPANLKYMQNAFYGCSSLTALTQLPKKLISIQYAFSNCTSLKDVSNITIPASCLEVSYAFTGCEALKGNIRVEGNPPYYMFFLTGIPNQITIVGSTTMKDKLLATQTAE